MDVLAKSLELAARHHAGQKDKAGEPYMLHPLRVMASLKTADVELMAIAVMHDLVEDSYLTLENLRYAGFSYRVVRAVKSLTRRKNEDYKNYIDNLISSVNVDAMMVKLADLEDNMNTLRLKTLTDSDFRRLRKYHKAHTKIKAALEDCTNGANKRL